MSNRRKIDLDAARRARNELEGFDSGPIVTLGGIDFELPPKLPASVIVGMARAQRREMAGFEEALAGLFRDRVGDVLLLGLELEDLDTIIEGAYGDEAETTPDKPGAKKKGTSAGE